MLTLFSASVLCQLSWEPHNSPALPLPWPPCLPRPSLSFSPSLFSSFSASLTCGAPWQPPWAEDLLRIYSRNPPGPAFGVNLGRLRQKRSCNSFVQNLQHRLIMAVRRNTTKIYDKVAPALLAPNHFFCNVSKSLQFDDLFAFIILLLFMGK